MKSISNGASFELKRLFNLFPRASKSFYEANNPRQISNPESECDQTPALDSADAGKAKGIHRASIRFTLYRVRPLDPDNAAGSCKDLLDGCRHAKLVSGDEWWRIEFAVRQKKVKSYAEEKTVIEITL